MAAPERLNLRAPQRQDWRSWRISRIRAGVGAVPGPMRSIGETLGLEAGVALEPLIAGLAADPVAPAEPGKRAWGVLGIEHETLTLVHG
jgi:hypothetical protein